MSPRIELTTNEHNFGQQSEKVPGKNWLLYIALYVWDEFKVAIRRALNSGLNIPLRVREARQLKQKPPPAPHARNLTQRTDQKTTFVQIQYA